ncbi:unnamed protein product [Owenia fusiformis]|uniref:Uncharacterized protein n=1 Tax=Owenia fusiformis TaxID=6347 RepID=A0A8J1TU00_OWEFU|nr:unnamed protein product [Owenia fusiformis]
MSSDHEWASIHDRDPIIHQAAYIGDLSKLRSLLKEQKQLKDINFKNRLGCTPLRLASTAGHTACVSYLIQMGAEVNVADVKAQTPLYVAVKNKHIDCVKILLENKADPNGNIQSLCSPLYIAAMDGFIEGVLVLVKYGADMNGCQISMGSFISTPLYISIAYHHLDCFKALLKAGADPDHTLRNTSNKGHTMPRQSLYHAVVRHNTDIDYAQLLYDMGACIYAVDDKNRQASEMNKKNECEEYIAELMCSPRSLASWCRINIRETLGKDRLHRIHELRLPSKLTQYVKFE